MRSGAPSSTQDAQHVLVGVAVVDLQRLAGALGQVDVPAERLLLRRAALGPGAEVVEPGLADHPDPGVRREPLDLGVRRGRARRASASRGASLGCSATPPPSSGRVLVDDTRPSSGRSAGRSRSAPSRSTPDRARLRRSRPSRSGAGPSSRARRCRGGCGCRRPRSAAAPARVAAAAAPPRGRAPVPGARSAGRLGLDVAGQPGQLLVDDRGVELGEDRGRLGRPGSRPRPAATPSAVQPAVVAGDDRVAPAPPSRSSTSSIRGIGATSPAPPRTSCTALALCGRNGESRVLQSLTACARTCRTVPSRSRSARALSFHGAWSETYLLTSPTTRIASASASFCRCRRDQVADGAEAGCGRRRAGPGPPSVSSPAAGISPKFLWIMRRRAVDQVAPARDELVVGAPDELGPGEVGVLVLRAGRGDEVAQRVGLVAREHVAHVDDDAAAGGELAALHREELAETTSVGRLQLAVLARRRRPGRPRRRRRAARPARSGSGR